MNRRSLTLSLLGLAGMILLAVTTCCVSPPAPEAPGAIVEGRTPAVQEAAAAKVQTTCVTPAGIVTRVGSGVLVSDRAVLTAHHVVDCDQPVITVQFNPPDAHVAVVEAVDVLGDVATLRIVTGQVALRPYAVIGPRPRAEARVCVVSAFPSRSRRCGEVERWSDLPGDVRHDVTTEPGNSGSGVYDARGRLVGIVTHYVTCSNGQLCGGCFTALEGRTWPPAVARSL